MVNVCPFDVPPPGVGLETVTAKLTPVSRSLAGNTALSCVELMNVVVRAVLLNSTTEAEIKPEPFTVRTRSGPVAVMDAGEIPLIIGAGFPTTGKPCVTGGAGGEVALRTRDADTEQLAGAVRGTIGAPHA